MSLNFNCPLDSLLFQRVEYYGYLRDQCLKSSIRPEKAMPVIIKELAKKFGEVSVMQMLEIQFEHFEMGCVKRGRRAINPFYDATQNPKLLSMMAARSAQDGVSPLFIQMFGRGLRKNDI